MSLSDAQIERFSRQIIHPRVGGSGQQRLLQARVAISLPPALLDTTSPYLAAAGMSVIHLDPGAPLAAFADCDADAWLCDSATASAAPRVAFRAPRPVVFAQIDGPHATCLRLLGRDDEPCIDCALHALDRAPVSGHAAAHPLGMLTTQVLGCALAREAMEIVLDPRLEAQRTDLDLAQAIIRETRPTPCAHFA